MNALTERITEDFFFECLQDTLREFSVNLLDYTATELVNLGMQTLVGKFFKRFLEISEEKGYALFIELDGQLFSHQLDAVSNENWAELYRDRKKVPPKPSHSERNIGARDPEISLKGLDNSDELYTDFQFFKGGQKMGRRKFSSDPGFPGG